MSLSRALSDMDRALPSGAVIVDREVCESYARDESEAIPTCPDAVVRVRGADDTSAVMRAASAHGIPVTPRGGGTGRTGGAVPVAGGIVLSFEKAKGIKGIEVDDMTATVEPGLVLADLHAAVEAEGLFYPPDPNSLSTCTLGGNVAENAAGPRTLRYGPTRDYILGLQVTAADGEILQLGKRTIKGVTGYDVTSLLVGSEGTLAITNEITVKLIPKPEAVVTLMVMLPDMRAAGQAVGAALSTGSLPRCVEMVDSITLSIMRAQAALSFPEGTGAMLIVELDGELRALDGQLERCGNAMAEAGALDVLVARHSGERDKVWAARRELSRALRAEATHKLSEDVVVPRSRIPDLLDACRAISETHGIAMPSYGHAGDGNIHVNFLWDHDEQKSEVDRAIEALFRQVIALGGTLSGEHGIGVLKAPYLGLEQGPAVIDLQTRIKSLFDPKGVLNPGKIFPEAVRRFHGPC